MQFAHTLPQVLNGNKTATRRLIQDGDLDLIAPPDGAEITTVGNHMYASGASELINAARITRIERNGRLLYYVGQTIAVQPGRGKAAVARIRVETLERDDDVRDITIEEAKLEGFTGPLAFLSAWNNMHDKQFLFCWDDRRADWLTYETHKGYDMMSQQVLYEELRKRPAERYAAWRIGFSLVTEKETK